MAADRRLGLSTVHKRGGKSIFQRSPSLFLYTVPCACSENSCIKRPLIGHSAIGVAQVATFRCWYAVQAVGRDRAWHARYSPTAARGVDLPTALKIRSLFAQAQKLLGHAKSDRQIPQSTAVWACSRGEVQQNLPLLLREIKKQIKASKAWPRRRTDGDASRCRGADSFGARLRFESDSGRCPAKREAHPISSPEARLNLDDSCLFAASTAVNSSASRESLGWPLCWNPAFARLACLWTYR
ncbi:hypothetical protein V8C35DRAFT_262712 [Trichoderma chlorosporum]